MRFGHFIAIAFLAAVNPLRGADPKPTVELEAFFEARIRPLFDAHCQQCHSTAKGKTKGGLSLDARESILLGGETGSAVKPGDPEASLLIKAVRRKDESLAMPPKEKLSAAEIADLEKWVRIGAPMPAKASLKTTADPRSHWAFRPIADPKPPKTKGEVATPVDAFLLAKLEKEGLAFSQPADKRTLLRRVYFDLIGLPPTLDEIRSFEADDSRDAFAKVVDRLLASPRYGERWARHWLDVARYADTKDGVLMFGDARMRPFAYTYRDYVIKAFNDDLPFDRFVREQLAADQLGSDPSRLAALGYLTLGRMFDGNVHDVIDDQIDVVGRGMLGLTVSCARCHDHKYDPIPTADYYSLYGVFSNTESPIVPPLLDPASKGPDGFEKQYADKKRDIESMLDSQYALLTETARQRVGDYLLQAATTPPDPIETAIFFMSLAPTDLRPPITGRWRTLLAARVKPGDPAFGPWYDFFAMPEADLPAASPLIIEAWRKRPDANVHIVNALASAKPETWADVVRAYGAAIKGVYEESKKAKGPPEIARSALLELLLGKESPGQFPKNQTRRYMSRGETDAFGGKLQALDTLAVKEANAPARAMAVQDVADIADPKIFLRGNPSRPGERIPRRFLETLSPGPRATFTQGSGRLDLANAITDTSNPLTSRVIANRVWMHHFGEPLVETPSDFGLRTPKPLQADLLEFLATSLRKDGWSIKKLHRLICLSNAYRQASAESAEARRRDPDNKLFWRMNRRRLDLESMRDAMLSASGRIDFTMYGRAVDAAGDPGNRRRTVYGLVDRQSLPGLFRNFDFASPDQSIERRVRTTVPQQSLFALNSPFVLEQARSLAARPDVANAIDPAAKVLALYRLALAREPSKEESREALAFIEAAEASPSKLGSWAQLAQVLLLTNEFLFVD